MANRRFEMHHYRQALVRMRLGDSDRQIAKSGLMGRTKASEFLQIAAAQGWLSSDQPVPDEAAIAAVLGGTPDAPAVSTPPRSAAFSRG